MAGLTIIELKKYCRIDDGIDDDDVTDMQKASEDYLTNAGIAKNYDDFRYKLAVKMLVSNWYENRGASIIGNISKEIEYGIESLIVQMQLSPKIIGVTS